MPRYSDGEKEAYLRGFEAGYRRRWHGEKELAGSHLCDCFSCKLTVQTVAEAETTQEREAQDFVLWLTPAERSRGESYRDLQEAQDSAQNAAEADRKALSARADYVADLPKVHPEGAEAPGGDVCNL